MPNMNDARPCPDCGALPGEYHEDGCPVEQCPLCGRQYIGCGCDNDEAERVAWSGEWPGLAECREFGWYAKLVPGEGWVPCGRDEPEAVEDINRLWTTAHWNTARRRFIRRWSVPDARLIAPRAGPLHMRASPGPKKPPDPAASDAVIRASGRPPKSATPATGRPGDTAKSAVVPDGRRTARGEFSSGRYGCLDRPPVLLSRLVRWGDVQHGSSSADARLLRPRGLGAVRRRADESGTVRAAFRARGTVYHSMPRETLRRYWDSPPVTVDFCDDKKCLKHGPSRDAIAQYGMLKRCFTFLAPVVSRLADASVSVLAAHELAHAYLFATSPGHGVDRNASERQVSDLLVREWGFAADAEERLHLDQRGVQAHDAHPEIDRR